MMIVRDVMTTQVTVIALGCPIADVAQLMRQFNIGALPVVRDSRMVGIISDRDIVLRVVADGLDPLMETAADHMTRDPVAAEPDWPLERAAAVMADMQIRGLPVVEDGQVVGYLALRDLRKRPPDPASQSVSEQ
jgi:CBS domain-containing protein